MMGLAKLPERSPVKLSIVVSPQLDAITELYRQTYGTGAAGEPDRKVSLEHPAEGKSSHCISAIRSPTSSE